MLIRNKKAPAAHKMQGGQPTPKPMAQTHTYPAPIGGLDLVTSRAMPSQGTARVLDNWICTQTGARARGGAGKYATLSSTGGVTALFSYNAPNSKFFGATADKIFDITTVADEDTIPTAAVSSQTSGAYSTQQFTTGGGSYLYVVNGADEAQLFDGTSWQAVNAASTPAITNVLTSALSFVWSFNTRLFFVEKDTLSAWYLPADNIGGAAAELSLAGIFRKGGSLLFGGAWSTDAGDGLGDKCLFFSTEGEVAIYEGTDPASSWTMVGLYDIGKPVGFNAAVKAGGDFLVATELGIIPMSRAVRLDVGALGVNAITSKIEPMWRDLINERASEQWEIIRHDDKGYMAVSTPDVGDASGVALIVNMQTGSWSRAVGWDAQCLGHFDKTGYFGTSGGLVLSMETAGSDNGTAYTCTYIGQFEALGQYGVQKMALNMRPVFEASSPFIAKVSAKADYNETPESPPNSPSAYTADTWDSGLWDTAVWDASVDSDISSSWRSVSGVGHVLAPEVQLTFGVTPVPSVDLVAVDLTYSMGALVT